MPMSAETIKALAATGAHVHIDASHYTRETSAAVLELVLKAGGHLTMVNSERYSSETLEALALRGRTHITFAGL